jgi:hypothetical protein
MVINFAGVQGRNVPRVLRAFQTVINMAIFEIVTVLVGTPALPSGN